MTHYEVLGVEPTASTQQIQQAWRRIAQQTHPDRASGNTQLFQQAQAAYRTLSDQQSRQLYDRQWRKPTITVRRTPPRNDQLRVTVPVSAADTFREHVKFVEIHNRQRQHELLQLRIPRGVQTHQIVRYPTMGPGGQDLLVKFVVEPPPGIELQGWNAVTHIVCNRQRALAGTMVQMMGLDQTLMSWTIPPDTRTNSWFVLSQQGLLKSANTDQRGDLYVMVTVSDFEDWS
jgi:DnaJ-class molecular chaperone